MSNPDIVHLEQQAPAIETLNQDIDRASLCCGKHSGPAATSKSPWAVGGICRGRQGCQVGISSILRFIFSKRKGLCSSTRRPRKRRSRMPQEPLSRRGPYLGYPFFCFTQRDLDRSRYRPHRCHASPDDANRGTLNAARGCPKVVDTFRVWGRNGEVKGHCEVIFSMPREFL